MFIQLWAIFNSVAEIQPLRIKASFWDMLGVFSYINALVLLEALLATVVILLVALLLPANLFRRHFVAQGTLILIIGTIWAIAMHYSRQTFAAPLARRWVAVQTAAFVGLVALFSWLARRFPALSDGLRSFAERATPLAMFYLVFQLLSVGILIIRNI